MRNYFLLLAMFFLTPYANASTLIQQKIPQAQIVASARYSVFLFDVYDATFYTVNGKPKVTPPFALKLSYLRSIEGEDIADRSAEEMRNQQGVDEVTLADWHSQMRNIFPNVIKGDSITGIYQDNTQCEFYKNNTYIGHVADSQFCNVFFDIWFGKNTSAPKLRNKLLGQQNVSYLGDEKQ